MSTASQTVEWWASPYDERTHLFGDTDEVTARAVCSHSVPTEQLTHPTEDNSRCLVCLITHGHELAVQMGTAGDVGAVWSPF
jgi:16S rRNA G527 N7-methylase RsmG